MSGNYNRKKIALAGALMFMVTSVSAQTVKGVVTDNTGEPIIGASVMEVGVAGNGVVTDLDGNFTVNLKGKSKKLKISYIGMKAKEVSVAGKETIEVKLEDDNTTLNDVVVIGYGIRASRISFHHSRMLPWYSVSGIVCCCGVSYHSCIPYVCGAKLLYSAQHSWSECVEFTASVVRQRTVVFPCCIRVYEQSCEDLVDYSFFHKFSVLCKFTYYFQIIARSRYKKEP